MYVYNTDSCLATDYLTKAFFRSTSYIKVISQFSHSRYVAICRGLLTGLVLHITYSEMKKWSSLRYALYSIVVFP